MKKIIYTCDECKKNIDINLASFKITSVIAEVELRMDFCGINCMKHYLQEKWKEEDREESEE